MSVRPRLGLEVPELTVRVARAGNPAGTTAMQLRTGSTGCGRMRTSPDGIPGRAAGDLTGAQLLFRLVAAANERRSLGIASHWPFDQWGRFLPEHTTAVSLLDNWLLHHAHLVITKGDSHRLAESTRRQGGDPAGHLTPPAGRTRGRQPGNLVAASPEKTRPPNRISQ
jgi:hypothetical protein